MTFSTDTTLARLAGAGYCRELGDGMVLRWSTADDVARISGLCAWEFRDERDDPADTGQAYWMRDLMSARHPLIGPADVAVVENTSDGTIVAATCLLSQVWTYDGVDLPVGRPEAVVTREEYRNRGFIRAIFELIHARSAALGHLAQGITGISYYYRQFGYEYALDFEGNRPLSIDVIPRLKEGETEPFRLREATPDDIPTVKALYDRDRAHALTSTRIDESYWRWALTGANPDASEGWRIYLIVTGDEGRAVGYVIAARWAWREGFNVNAISVADGVPLAGVLPAALRALCAVATAAPRRPHAEPPATLLFSMGRAHPVYEALGDLLPPAPRRPYPWYVRVPDLPAFLRRIAPVLERRLRDSVVAGYSGAVTLDFYRHGLRMVFTDGRLATVENWRRGAWGMADGSFPPAVFPQLLFGYRGLDELRDIYPDVEAAGAAVPLLRALFPPHLSWVVPLD